MGLFSSWKPDSSTLETKMIDFNGCPVNKRVYGGLSGAKIGIVYEGADYLVKFPRNEKEKGLRNVRLSYSNSPVCEYIGSHIYEMLGIPVHQTLLGTRLGKTVVACKDFRNRGDELQEFRELKTTFEPHFVDSEGNATDGQGMDIDEVIQTIHEHPRLKDKPEVKERFWNMFVIDAYIGNTDRNNGNWGLILRYDQSEELAPVYDNGACLNSKWDEEKMQKYLDDPTLMMAQAYKGIICIYTQGEKKKRINPYQYMEKTKNPDCLAAIKRIVPKLQEQQANILSFIKNIPCLTDTQRKFYDTLLNTRLKMGLLPIYEKHFCDSISRRR